MSCLGFTVQQLNCTVCLTQSADRLVNPDFVLGPLVSISIGIDVASRFRPTRSAHILSCLASCYACGQRRKFAYRPTICGRISCKTSPSIGPPMFTPPDCPTPSRRPCELGSRQLKTGADEQFENWTCSEYLKTNRRRVLDRPQIDPGFNCVQIGYNSAVDYLFRLFQIAADCRRPNRTLHWGTENDRQKN